MPYNYIMLISKIIIKFVSGSLIFGLGFVFARVSVNKIILLKGGNSMYVETFGLWGLRIQRTVPLDEVSITETIFKMVGRYLKRQKSEMATPLFLLRSLHVPSVVKAPKDTFL